MRNIKLLKKITIDALFIALLIIFTFVPYVGYITIGPISFTTIHVIVLVSAALFGVRESTLFGFVFGFLSLLKALQFPSTVDYFFVNPFISILPRVLFGFLSGISFDYLKKIKKFSLFISLVPVLAFILTIVHSFLTLTSLYVFGLLDVFNISSMLGLGKLINDFLKAYPTFIIFIGANVTLGALLEAVLAAIVVPSIYLAVNKIYHINNLSNTNENKKE